MLFELKIAGCSEQKSIGTVSVMLALKKEESCWMIGSGSRQLTVPPLTMLVGYGINGHLVFFRQIGHLRIVTFGKDEQRPNPIRQHWKESKRQAPSSQQYLQALVFNRHASCHSMHFPNDV